MIRRRGPLRNVFPLLGALALVGLVLWVGSHTFSTKDSEIVRRAAVIRTGDRATGQPPAPVVAIELLRGVVSRNPDHYDAYMELAACWADLRAWDKAVFELEQAARSTEDINLKIRAMSRSRSFLSQAERYDESVEVARAVAALQPDQPLYELKIGQALYEASRFRQRDLSEDYSLPDRGVDGVAAGDLVEDFITDIWSEPDAEALALEIMPEVDVITRRRFVEALQDTREKFIGAVEILSEYRNMPGFEQSVCRAFVEMLYRTGRLYEAHIEASIALREELEPEVAREFLETQAYANLDVGQYEQAAESLEALVRNYEEDGQWPPLQHLFLLYEARLDAGQWDWILENVDETLHNYGRADQTWFLYAKAAAQAVKGDREAARETIQEPFVAVALGATRSMQSSVRHFPYRRHAVLVLAYELFEEIDDSRAIVALDAILGDFPRDADIRRLRIDQNLEAGRVEAARDDALVLLRTTERNQDDFDNWLAIANDLSVARRGTGLFERASALVDDAELWQEKHGNALFVSSRVGERVDRSLYSETPVQLHWPQEPALSWAIVEELIRRNALETARTNLRRLVEQLPDIPEFRYQLGRLLVRDGMIESASAEFHELLEDIPGDTEVLDLAMRTDVALGRHEEAAELLNRMILEDPLGVGAVRYGQRLLEEGRPDKAEKLIRRLLNWDEALGKRSDVLILSGRVNIAKGNYEMAEGILGTLANHHADSVDVAILAANLGLAQRNAGLVEEALTTLKPLAGSIFPDRMPVAARRLLDAGLYEELLELFDEDVRVLPAAKPALRSVIRAATALGRVEEADDLFGMLEDEYAPVDRFLLLSLNGRADEAGRRLRLEVVSPELRDLLDLCVMVRSGILRHQSLMDVTPMRRLEAFKLHGLLDAQGRELMDAVLRLSPMMRRLDDVVPAEVVEQPRATYPRAGRDVAALIELGREDPDAAERVSDMLMLLLLMGERPFWNEEAQFLAEEIRATLPASNYATQVLAEDLLARGRGDEALELVKPLMLTQGADPAPRTLALFMDAADAADKRPWGLAVALELLPRNDVLFIVADALRRWGHPEESLPYFEQYLETQPDDPEALAGVIQALMAVRDDARAEPYVARALDLDPSPTLATICADALFEMQRPTPRAVMLMERMFDEHPELIQVAEALARARIDDVAEVDAILGTLVSRLERTQISADQEENRRRSMALVRAVQTTRKVGLTDRARELNNIALRFDPGSINRYRELAFLEMEDGDVDTARRYLEVLSFINLTDRDSARALAELYAEQLGQPMEAAAVVRRTFLGQAPPWAVAILAAEDYLLGEPEAAINKFSAVRASPLLSDDVYYAVARIAYASHMDDTARSILEYVTVRGDREHPFLPRARWLLKQRLPPPAEPETAAVLEGA